MTLKEIWDLVQGGGTLGVLVAILYGGYRGWWYFGHVVTQLREELERQRKETQRWQDEALHLLKIADKSVTTVEHQTKRRRDVEDVS